MTQPIYKHLDGQSAAELRNFLLGTGTAAPTVDGIIQRRSGRIETREGGTVQQLAFLTDVAGASPFRGTFSAATGALPTAAGATIRANEAFTAGQYVRITDAGTIANIGGADALKAGDLLLYVGGTVTDAANWTGISQSLDLAPYMVRQSVTLASLPANTATRVAPNAGMSTIVGYEIFSSTGIALKGSLDETFAATGASSGVTLTSLVALSNLTVNYIGLV